MRLATTVKKKIIPHICQPSQKNTKTLGSCHAAWPLGSISAYPICTATCQRFRTKPTLTNLRNPWFCPCGKAVAKFKAVLLEENR